MNNRIGNMRALACGVLGCLCYGGGDWLMIYELRMVVTA